MTTQTKALKMALEALEGMQNAIYNIYGEHVIDLKYAVEKADVAEQTITAVKEALAQMQEPVAWMNDMGTHIDLNVSGRGMPLYTTPPQRKPLLDEFGCWWFEYGSGLFPLEGEDQEEHSYRVATAAWQAAHGIKGD